MNRSLALLAGLILFLSGCGESLEEKEALFEEVFVPLFIDCVESLGGEVEVGDLKVHYQHDLSGDQGAVLTPTAVVNGNDVGYVEHPEDGVFTEQYCITEAKEEFGRLHRERQASTDLDS